MKHKFLKKTKLKILYVKGSFFVTAQGGGSFGKFEKTSFAYPLGGFWEGDFFLRKKSA